MLRVVCVALCAVSVSAATPTPPPTANPSAVNPELIGHCCSPGRCNTDTSATHVDPTTGVTTGSASDCAQFFIGGKRETTVDWAECKTQAGCTKATNSCGGNSGVVYVAGEWCAADAKPGKCCAAGQCGKAESGDCGLGASAGWAECKFKAGCEDKQSQCGGYNTAAQWCSGTTPDNTPTSPKGKTTGNGDNSSKKSGGGMSGGAIAGIVIAALVVVGIAGFMYNRPAEPEGNDDYHKAADGTYAPPSAGGDQGGSATVEHDRL